MNNMKQRGSTHTPIPALVSGFTLIEMMVAVTIFSIVMLVAVGSLLSIIDANRKAQTLKSVTNNLTFAIESMSRSARVGSRYHCGTGFTFSKANLDAPQDCEFGGGILFAFERQNGDTTSNDDQIVYRYDASNHRIERSIDGGDTFILITAPEIRIESFEVNLIGSHPSDYRQPRAVFHIAGSISINDRIESTFNIQTSATPRILDQPPI